MKRVVPSWLDQEFESVFVIDDQDVGRLLVRETTTDPDLDPVVSITGKFASQTTPDATVVELPLPWSAANGDVWAIEAYVTAKGTDVRRRIKASALVYGAAGVATLDGAVDVDAKGTGTPTASITVDGTTPAIYLELTPGDDAAFTWGFELRGQRL